MCVCKISRVLLVFYPLLAVESLKIIQYDIARSCRIIQVQGKASPRLGIISREVLKDKGI